MHRREWLQRAGLGVGATLPWLAAATTRAAESVGPVDFYDYAEDYGRLRGRLEYSLSTRQQKLRYIPIDGRTDDFGGSVVLPDLPAMDEFAVGEFVTVEGLVDRATGEEFGFAPHYRLRHIRRTQLAGAR